MFGSIIDEESTAAVRYDLRVAGIFYTLIFLAHSMAVTPFTVEIVLDGSESMATPVGDSTIQTMVQDAIVSVVAEAQTKPGQLTLGLRVAGGGEKGGDPCSATEPLIQLSDPDWNHWTEALNRLKPRGERNLNTPVVNAITNVARNAGPSRVVVITTGGDQCESNPRDVAAALSATDHTVELRLVGLNLDSATMDAFGSLELRNATNPAELLDAIRWAVLKTDHPEGDGTIPEPTPTEIPVVLSAPDRIAAGEMFELSWSGPEGPEDFLSLAAEESTDDDYLDWARTEEGSPVHFSAPLEPGVYELRYVDGESGTTRAHVSIEVFAVPVELRVPATATAGMRFEIGWTANPGDGDFVTIAKPKSSARHSLDWASTATGSPTTLAAPNKPGTYEVRYFSSRARGIVARATIEVRP